MKNWQFFLLVLAAVLVFVALVILPNELPGWLETFEEPMDVTIVHIRESDWNGDWTCVQFEDGERRYRQGRWGEVGDKFKARKSSRGSWK